MKLKSKLKVQPKYCFHERKWSSTVLTLMEIGCVVSVL